VAALLLDLSEMSDAEVAELVGRASVAIRPKGEVSL
jgi:hypothetical protein